MVPGIFHGLALATRVLTELKRRFHHFENPGSTARCQEDTIHTQLGGIALATGDHYEQLVRARDRTSAWTRRAETTTELSP